MLLIFAIKANLFMQLCIWDFKTFFGVDFWTKKKCVFPFNAHCNSTQEEPLAHCSQVRETL